MPFNKKAGIHVPTYAWGRRIPHPRQLACIKLFEHYPEIFFGGQAGGGKSEVALFVASQYVDIRGYHSLILRKTFSDLNQSGAIMDRAREYWSKHPKVKWVERDKKFTFYPSGATITFGYLKAISDHYQYLGSEFSTVIFDESTQIRANQINYLVSRLRTPVNINLPKRLLLCGNPGGPSHDWHRENFVYNIDKNPKRIFIPSAIEDNPSLDYDEYSEQLEALEDPVERARLLHGDWDITPNAGLLITEEFINEISESPIIDSVRSWDLAGTAIKDNDGKIKGDYTVGVLLHKHKDRSCTIGDVVRGLWRADQVESQMKKAAYKDGYKTKILIEQEPGSAGKNYAAHLTRMLSGYKVSKVRPTGSKIERCKPFAAALVNGHVYWLMTETAETKELISEMNSFPKGKHDDFVDAVSQGYNHLFQRRPRIVGGG